MALTPGTRLGPYEVVAQIGVGGMGEVYKATDTNLKRSVAIKVLPASVADDAARLARFQREAEVLAALNHPNIAQIYGLETSGGMTALVMELVEGDDLSQRIARGAIPLDEALSIAKQIAEALEAAHEQGIIHRDLKPANIKVRSDGTVKVLDFGLAKAMEPAAGVSPSMSQAPTITTPALMTGAGVILGTAAYMSPEQARGQDVDKRADLWAFSVVLWEMLAGTRLFEGATVSDTLAAVLKTEPPWSMLAPATPPAVRRLLRRCLEKDRKRRLDSAGAARLDLEEALATPEVAVVQSGTSSSLSRRGGRLAWSTVGISGVALVAVLVAWAPWQSTPAQLETRVDVVTLATNQPTMFALSPDGRQIAFVASGDGASRLWLRSLATTTAQPLAGTEGATFPFWSPDSRSIGFFAAGSLKRLDLGGNAPQILAPALPARGGTWSADGVVVFAPGTTNPLMRVPATGGAATAVTTLGPQQGSHRFPQMLPDGRRFVFYVQGGPETTGIYLGSLDGGAPTRLTPANVAGVFLPSGWLLWTRMGTLVAQRLDVTKAALVGEPVTVAEGVAVTADLSAVSVAATGLVAYRAGGGSDRQLHWFDRSGMARGTIGDPDGSLSLPRVSPDGRRVAVERTVQGNMDIWLLDETRTTRFTFDAATDQFPLWSSDATRIVFRSRRTGTGDLYQRLANGAGGEERLVTSDQLKTPTSRTTDGRFLLYQSTDPQTDADLWVVPLVGDHTPWVWLKTRFRETNGAFSPDGQWVAYMSSESGRNEIYVRPFAAADAASTGQRRSGQAAEPTGGQWQVSTTGGIHPVWRADGRELYYLNPEGEMMAAPITATGSTLEQGQPVALFPTRITGGGVDIGQGRQYDVAPDGRFLINTELAGANAPITLIQNWKPPAR